MQFITIGCVRNLNYETKNVWEDLSECSSDSLMFFKDVFSA